MTISQQKTVITSGVIAKGGIALDHPLAIPDGVRVNVSVEKIESDPSGSKDMSDADFRSLPFLGEWSDRTDLGSSSEHVREERAKWSQRPARQA